MNGIKKQKIKYNWENILIEFPNMTKWQIKNKIKSYKNEMNIMKKRSKNLNFYTSLEKVLKNTESKEPINNLKLSFKSKNDITFHFPISILASLLENQSEVEEDQPFSKNSKCIKLGLSGNIIKNIQLKSMMNDYYKNAEFPDDSSSNSCSEYELNNLNDLCEQEQMNGIRVNGVNGVNDINSINSKANYKKEDQLKIDLGLKYLKIPVVQYNSAIFKQDKLVNNGINNATNKTINGFHMENKDIYNYNNNINNNIFNSNLKNNYNNINNDSNSSISDKFNNNDKYEYEQLPYHAKAILETINNTENYINNNNNNHQDNHQDNNNDLAFMSAKSKNSNIFNISKNYNNNSSTNLNNFAHLGNQDLFHSNSSKRHFNYKPIEISNSAASKFFNFDQTKQQNYINNSNISNNKIHNEKDIKDLSVSSESKINKGSFPTNKEGSNMFVKNNLVNITNFTNQSASTNFKTEKNLRTDATAGTTGI